MGTAAQLFMKSLLMGADHALDRSEYSSFEIEALPFEAAVKYMTKKMPMKAEEYYRLSDKERFRAFTVGRIADGAILERVKKALADNMKEKTGFSTFLKQTDREILDAVGMGTGKPWYWETVYRTNIQTSYNVGRALGFEATQPLALEFVGLEDDRQTDICRKLSEARIIRPYGDPFWDTHTPPLHFNCRSTLRAIYDRDELPEEYAPIKNEKTYTPAKGFGSAPTKGDSWWEELSGMKAQAQRYGVQEEIEAAREKLAVEKPDYKMTKSEEKIFGELSIKKQLDYYKVPRKAIEPINKNDSESDIIARLEGGDLTVGSCSSLAFAYAANKNGWAVTDYRDGYSRNVFSLDGNIAAIAGLPGVRSWIEKQYSDFEGAKRVLENVEAGKEYYFACGQHAAIVRKEQGKLRYLELQRPEPKDNGFKIFAKDTLKKRFSAQKSYVTHGLKAMAATTLIDISSFSGNNIYMNLMEYINTNLAAQKKGAAGSVR